MTNYEGVYGWQRDVSARSARAILPLVFDNTNSVVDVGCGFGAWAKVAEEMGAEAVGLDGSWVPDPLIAGFRAIDLNHPFTLERRFDLVISVEVAEHLPPERGESFVADLCRLSDRVLFGAAIPHQGGDRHINERWQDYWADRFREQGYEPQDVIRPRVWDDPDVAAWYAQNTLLYVRGGPTIERFPLRIVHPGVYEWSIKVQPASLRSFPAALRRSMGYRVAQLRRRRERE